MLPVYSCFCDISTDRKANVNIGSSPRKRVCGLFPEALTTKGLQDPASASEVPISLPYVYFSVEKSPSHLEQ